VEESKYGALGVSASKSGLHRALDQSGLTPSGALFAQVSADLAGNSEYYSFVHCDGAGTKTIVPYLHFRETKSRSLFSGLAQDALVMNLDDIYCIGSPEKLLLANTVARNARLIDDETLAVLFDSYRALASTLAAQGILIELAGGETADCGDVVRTLVVDAVLCGRIKKSSIVDAGNIVPGDVIVGLSSTGQAIYENMPNSGIGSNGLTLARHAMLSREYAKDYPEVVDPNLSPDDVYRGPFFTTDRPEGLEMSVGEALASPTRTYAPVIARVLDTLGSSVHGIIHVTGGGQTKVLRFGRGNIYIKDNLFAPPPVFSLIQRFGHVAWREMYQVFNMGHRMEFYLPEEFAATVFEISSSFGIDARIIGRVERNNEAAASNKVTIECPYGSFDYTL